MSDIIQVSNCEDTIYLNASIKGDGEYIPLVYNQNFTQSLVNKASDYYLSIIRFQLPSGSLPIWIYDDTVSYRITLDFNGATSSADVLWQNQNPNTTAGDDKFLYSISPLVDMVNNACSRAYSGWTGGPTGITGPPLCYYNNDNKQFAFIFQQGYRNLYDPTGATGVSVRLSNALARLFLSMPYQYDERQPDESLFRFQMVSDPIGTSTSSLPSPYNSSIYFQLKETYSSFSTQNPVKSIIFQTNMPIRYETFQSVSKTSSNLQINYGTLTDFAISELSIGETVLDVTYNAIRYRYSTFVSDLPLNNVNFSVIWTDQKGNIYPYRINNNTIANVKFAFIKRR
jgi:hypothetical protein